MLWRAGRARWRYLKCTSNAVRSLILDNRTVSLTVLYIRGAVQREWHAAAAFKVSGFQDHGAQADVYVDESLGPRDTIEISSAVIVEVAKPREDLREVMESSGESVSVASKTSAPLRVPVGRREKLASGEPRASAPLRVPSPKVLALLNVISSRNVTKEAALARLKMERGSDKLSQCLLDREQTAKLAGLLADSAFAKSALQLLRLAHKLGCKLKQNAYEGVAYRYAENKLWHLIPPLVTVGEIDTGRTTLRLLNWRARALIEIPHYVLLDGVLDGFKQANLQPNRRTFHLLISGHIRNRDLRKARLYLQKMELAGFPVEASTYATVISVYRSLGPDAAVQAQAVDALPDVGTSAATTILNSLMQFCIDGNDLPGVIRVLSLFDHGTLPPFREGDSGQYVAERSEDDSLHDSAGTSNTQHSSSSPLSPNAATVARLISFMSIQQGLPVVLQVFYRMQAAGIVLNASIAASLVRAHFLVGEDNTAVRIVAGMCPPNVPHDLFYRLGLNLEDFESRRPFLIPILPTADVFNALLKGVLKSQGLNGMCAVLHIMRAASVGPDSNTIKIFIDYLERVEHLRPREIIRVLRTLAAVTAPPNLKHIHTIFKLVLRREKFLLHGSGWNSISAKVSNQQKSNPKERLSGTTSSLDPTASIKLPRIPNLRALMRPIISSLSARNLRNDSVMYALRIKRDGMKADMASARNAFQDMIRRGIHPNEFHYSALMEGYASSGDLEGATATMREAIQAGLKANAVMFTILISGYARQGKPQMAMQAFHEMVTSGIAPDVPAVDAVASAFFAVGRYADAKRVLLDLWTSVKPFPSELGDASLARLARVFRSEHGLHRDSPKRLSQGERRMLRWKIGRLLRYWRRSALKGGRSPA